MTGGSTSRCHASLDDEIVIVGTANNSREVNVIVDDAAITQAWDSGMFLRDFTGGVVVDQRK